jgi:hypothetical protein
VTKNRPDGWAHFLYLYANVVEDIPLVVCSPEVAKHISNVTAHFDQAREPITDDRGKREMLFKVTSNIRNNDGHSGDIFVFNSFSLDP